MAITPLKAIFGRDRLVVALSLIGLGLLAWLLLVYLALRMDPAEGITARMMGIRVEDGVSARLSAALGPAAAAQADALVNFVIATLMWAIMMVGMMLPSAAPTILLFAALETKRVSSHQGPNRITAFVTGYFAIWSAFSVGAAALQTVLAHAGLISAYLSATGNMLAGALFVVAGLYEFTPLKDFCLRHCRSPLEWIPRHMKPGRPGALRMGVEHGAHCVGCCWVLMLLLFVGGVMNLLWVAAIAAAVMVQKLLSGRSVLDRLAGAALIVAGLVVLISPSGPG